MWYFFDDSADVIFAVEFILILPSGIIHTSLRNTLPIGRQNMQRIRVRTFLVLM